MKVCGTKSVFLAGIGSMYLPIAHAEGKFVPRDPRLLDLLESGAQLVLRYQSLSDDGDVPGPVPYPDNPNGSVADTAGICDPTGRVLGLMPHPERHVDPTQHPRWTRGEAAEVGDGMKVFVNAVEYFA